MLYSISRLSHLDVKWASLFNANEPSFKDFHQNPFCELIMVTEGSVHLQAEEERLTLEAGETLLLMPWERHRGWNSSERQGSFFWVQFSCYPAPQQFSSDRSGLLGILHSQRSGLRTEEASALEPVIIPKQFLTGHRFRLLGIFERLLEVLDKPKGYFRYQATILLNEMLYLLASDFLGQFQDQAVFPPTYDTFKKLVDHINSNYEKGVSTATLEKITSRKYEYLCQVFKKYAGFTIISYVHRLRIQKAKYLLANTAWSIQYIGESVGYADPFYFSRMFKRLEGISPQGFRQNMETPLHSWT